MSRLVLFGAFLTSITVTALGSVSVLTDDETTDEIAIVRLDDQHADHAARVAALEQGFEELKKRIDQLLARRSGQVVTPRGDGPVVAYRVELDPDGDTHAEIADVLVQIEEGRYPEGVHVIELRGRAGDGDGHDHDHAHAADHDHDDGHDDGDDQDHGHGHGGEDITLDLDIDLGDLRTHLEHLGDDLLAQGHEIDLDELHAQLAERLEQLHAELGDLMKDQNELHEEHQHLGGELYGELMELADEHMHGDHAEQLHEHLMELDEHLHHGDDVDPMLRRLEEMAEHGISIDEKQMQEMATYLEDLIEREAGNFMPFVEEALERIESLIEREAPYFEELIEEALESLEDVLSNEEESIENFVEEFEAGLEDAMVDEGEHLQSLVEAALEHLEEVLEREAPHFESLVEEAMEHVEEIAEHEGAAFEELIERALQQLEEVLEREGPVLEEMMQQSGDGDPFASRFETHPPILRPEQIAPGRLRVPMPRAAEGHHQQPTGRIMGRLLAADAHRDGEMIILHLRDEDDDEQTNEFTFEWSTDKPVVQHGEGDFGHIVVEVQAHETEDGGIVIGDRVVHGFDMHHAPSGHGQPSTDEIEEVWEHARHVLEMGDDLQDPRTIALMAILQSRKLEPMARIDVLMPVLHEVDDRTLRAAAMMALLEVADDIEDQGLAAQILRMIILESDDLLD